jgi:hypothetical protein
MRIVAVALAGLTLCACGGAASGAGGSAAPRPDVTLRVRVSDDQRGPPLRATLTCRETATASGFLSDHPRAHCRSARRLARFLTSKPNPHRACTEIYGGPQTARITGRIGTTKVDRRFHRADGCGIADWHRARDLLGGEPG